MHHRYLRAFVLAVSLTAGLAGTAAAQEPAAAPTPAAAAPTATADPRQTFHVARAATEIKVDGVLDEEAWQQATSVPIRYEWTPGDNVEPPVKTEGLVTYDGDNVYVAFRAHDPKPAEIRAHLMDRDSIDTFVQDDHVVFLIDTFNDERRAYQFRVNPLGVQADAINGAGGGSGVVGAWANAAPVAPRARVRKRARMEPR
jgi:hypothetical protein